MLIFVNDLGVMTGPSVNVLGQQMLSCIWCIWVPIFYSTFQLSINRSFYSYVSYVFFIKSIRIITVFHWVMNIDGHPSVLLCRGMLAPKFALITISMLRLRSETSSEPNKVVCSRTIRKTKRRIRNKNMRQFKVAHEI